MRSPSGKDQNKCMCIVIDDMDAFEVFAPTGQKSRMFISRLIQSVSRRKPNGSSSSGRVVSRLGRSSGGSCDSSAEVETNQGVSSKINTVVVYGHIPHSHSQEHSNGNPFFTSSVQINFLGNGNSKYEPSLTEYCRYR